MSFSYYLSYFVLSFLPMRTEKKRDKRAGLRLRPSSTLTLFWAIALAAFGSAVYGRVE